LSTEYINVKQKFQFKCRCGKLGCKTLHDFINSPQCFDCGIENRSGENHPNWNPNLTDNERMKNRKFKEYEYWRLAVYERDNYTCQCCDDNKGGNLNAHHLDSHDWAKDKRLDLDNAITLCVNCHTDFHMTYGYGNNTKEQFEEYMNDI
jgi:5-methylcytosine-specific restriction endonuclease McrA